ncbi:MAG: M20 family metallopeptidase [Victivallaceae bacterium]|nr:M20 family metallopeptidase [Victivallaceae bacterium]
MIRLDEDIMRAAVDLRHELHRHPELAGREDLTCKIIRDALDNLGLLVFPPRIGTDTVAVLDTGRPGATTLLRADIDGLAVTEDNRRICFASEHPGRMHACGHDVHSSALFGAAAWLARNSESLSGRVVFVWQPGEENLHLGKNLVETGLLEYFGVEHVAAFHCLPGLPLGAVYARSGTQMAGSAHFKVVIHGRGGHGSRPDLATSPIEAAADAVLRIGRHLNDGTTVCSIGRLASGEMDNVIPDDAEFSGTLRTLDAKSHDRALVSLGNMLDEVDAVRGTSHEIVISSDYPPAVNDLECFSRLRQAIQGVAGLEFMEMDSPRMTAEDFAFYLERRSGVIMFIGSGDGTPLHNPKMFVPDEVVGFGARYLIAAALEFCR